MKLTTLYKLNTSNLTTWIAVVLVAMIIIGNTGFWPMPNLPTQFLVSQNLAHNPFPDPLAQYIFTNYLQPAIFGILGGKTIAAYGIYASFLSMLFLVVFAVWFINYHGKAVAIDEFKLFPAIVFPSFMIPFYWIGMDGMTCLLMLLTMMSFTSRWGLFWAVMLGMQHFEQGIVGFALLAGTLVAAYIHRRDEEILKHLWRAGLIGGGVIVGKIMLSIWFAINVIELSDGRASYLETHFDLFASTWVKHWPLILWSLLGVGWLLILKHVTTIWPFLLAVVGAFLLVLFAGDQTRVGVIVLFPSLFYWVLMNKDLWKKTSSLLATTMLVLYFIAPVTVVWGAPRFGNLWTYDNQVIRQAMKSDFSIEGFDFLKPFKSKNEAIAASNDCKHFNAGVLPSDVVRTDDHGNLNYFKNGEEGFLSFGPYISLDKGNYWGIFTYASQAASGSIVGWIDVTLNQGTTILARRPVLGTGAKLELVDIPFSLEDKVDGVEIRFFVDGSAPVSLNSLDILRDN